jgi:hypothetical protein
MTSKRILGALLAAGIVLGSGGAAFAGEPGDTGKCNSGRGNQSETDPANDCDPGKSGGHNNGGD